MFPSSLEPSRCLVLKQLLHVPKITKNLLSVSKFAHDNNVYFEFHSTVCFIKDQAIHTILLMGKLEDGLYVFDKSQIHLQHGPVFTPQSSLVSQEHKPIVFASSASLPSFVSSDVSHTTCTTFDLRHNRFGHPSDKVVKVVLAKCNISYSDKVVPSLCQACCLGKLHKLPFPSSNTEYTKPLQLIHSDLWGPSPTISANGYRYYVHFIDATTRFTWIYMLRQKSDALQTFENFKKLVELQLDSKILAVQTDWGGEYRPFTTLLQSFGIVHRHLCPHSHEQNGLAERKHRTIIEHGLTLLAKASLPLKFWDEVFRASVFVSNRLPTSILGGLSPVEKLFHTPPVYSQLRVFGCLCFPNLRPYSHHKFNFHSSPCTFLGYSLNHKGYKCLDSPGKIVISRDVLFDEYTFPFAQKATILSPYLLSPHCLSLVLFLLPILPLCLLNLCQVLIMESWMIQQLLDLHLFLLCLMYHRLLPNQEEQMLVVQVLVISIPWLLGVRMVLGGLKFSWLAKNLQQLQMPYRI